MDVVWNSEKQQATPIAITALSSPNPVATKPLIPVIFINNNVIAQIDSSQLQPLATNLLDAARGFIQKNGATLKELQIDCDWTAKTRDRYFLLLRYLKEASPEITYAATIRLYPFKYDKQMGVPPVDYGALMIYNLAPIKNPEEVNSIFTYDEAIKYKRQQPYPIPLKAIVPVFGWYAWFGNEEYKGIIYESPDFIRQPFFTQTDETQFQITKDTVLNGVYVRAGDILRNEFPTHKDLSALVKNLNKLLPETDEIIFYHWNEDLLQHYDTVIKEIANP